MHSSAQLKPQSPQPAGGVITDRTHPNEKKESYETMDSQGEFKIRPGDSGQNPSKGNGRTSDKAYITPKLSHSFNNIPIHSTKALSIQPKLTVNTPGDKYEQEADAVADKIMRIPEGFPLQRKCVHCEEEEEKKVQRKPLSFGITPTLQTKSETGATEDTAISSHITASQGRGRSMDEVTQSFMSNRFGVDFGKVKIDTDNEAAKMNRLLNARAFTTGNHIYFNTGQYQPVSYKGSHLLAHELTHVIQQGAVPFLFQRNSLFDSNSDDVKKIVQHEGVKQSTAFYKKRGTIINSAPRMISRANITVVRKTMGLGRRPGSGLQFWPTNVTDTQVGPVTVQGGLVSGGADRLNVILGENITMKALARQLLPLWTSATPFTPPGAAAPLPLDIITEDELAKGLTVYNQYYLPVPAMSNWRAGLRFPLPAEIDNTTGIATLHPLQIRQLATAFDTKWLPILDQKATGIAAPAATTVQASVTAFLTSEATATGRGLHLMAESLTNTVAELPFVRETFRQLGPSSFDVALGFMDFAVNPEIALLAAQRDGALILAEIKKALAAAPAALTSVQQTSLDRANLMFGLVSGIVAVAPPTPIALSADELTARIARCIGVWETNRGGINPIPGESDLDTVSGIRASMAASIQTTMSHAITSLRKYSTLRNAAVPPLTMHELGQADARCTAVQTLLRLVHTAVTAGQSPVDFIRTHNPAIIASGLTDADVRVMFSADELKATIDTSHREAEVLHTITLQDAVNAIPAGDRVGLGGGSLKSYIRNPSNWGENTAAWQRKAVNAMPGNIGARIEGVVISDGGTKLAIPEIKDRVNRELAKTPVPSQDDIIRRVAQQNNPGSSNYGNNVLSTYKRLYP